MGAHADEAGELRAGHAAAFAEDLYPLAELQRVGVWVRGSIGWHGLAPSLYSSSLNRVGAGPSSCERSEDAASAVSARAGRSISWAHAPHFRGRLWFRAVCCRGERADPGHRGQGAGQAVDTR